MVDELIRDRIHEALEVEPPPAHLRMRVMASLPVSNRRIPRPAERRPGEWAAGLVAVLLAAAIIAGLLLVRGIYVPARHQPAPPVGLISPDGVAVGPDGSVYVSDSLGDRIFRLRPDGKVVVYAGGGAEGDGPAIKANLFHPIGLALDRDGNLYVDDAPAATVRRIDTAGRIATLNLYDSDGTPFIVTVAPMGLAVDHSGALWLSELDGSILKIDASGLTTRLDTSSLPPPHWLPGFIAFGPDGSLYISDRAPGTAVSSIYTNPVGGGCRIVRVSSDGKLSVIAGTGICGYSGDGGPAVAAQLNDPGGIAFDSAGSLYFADANNHRIRRIDRNGVITTVAGTGVQGYNDGPAAEAQLQFPFGMGMSSSGLLYFADMTCQCWNPTAPGRLRALNLATGVITTVMDGQTRIQT